MAFFATIVLLQDAWVFVCIFGACSLAASLRATKSNRMTIRIAAMICAAVAGLIMVMMVMMLIERFA